MRKYEMLFIVDGCLTDEEKEKAVISVKEIVEKTGAVASEPDKWGMRKFAYPINYKNDGFYCLMNFEAEDSAIAEINGKLNINKNVVRQMIVAK